MERLKNGSYARRFSLIPRSRKCDVYIVSYISKKVYPKVYPKRKQPPKVSPKWLFFMVGATRFELATTRPPV